ncbi:MAG: sulfotransferase [Phycisphaerales bacterium]|nr:sulfotransferase [Phycisphaerales bacterium]
MKSDERASREGRWETSRIGWPVSHLLALAPLDVWLRMLARADGVHPRYWPRLAFVLFTSFVGTVISVHERVLWRVWGLIPMNRDRLERFRPEVIVILGYYRSGTTHLQNLMACDERLITPRWYQCLAGQGYILAWTLIRFLLVPFLGRTRPQDSVGFGTEWPGEDDFALATWGGCSSLAGRHVFPKNRELWQGWHALEGLSEKQLRSWRTLTRRFVYKITRRKRGRIVVLKSPSHTARVAELDRLFDGRVRFVHLVREPGAVIDSNVRMFHALRNHAMQELPVVQSIRDGVVAEYEATERKCADELDAIDADRWVRVRFKDLRSDPMGVLSEIYTGLGMAFEPGARDVVQRYLGSLGSYSSEREPIELGKVSEHEQQVCAAMTERYGLGSPARLGKPMEYTPRDSARIRRGMLGGLGMAAVCWIVWLGLVWAQHAIDHEIRARMVALVWATGAMVGIAAHKASGGRGSRSLGVFCAVLTLMTAVTVLFPVSVINWNWAANDGTAMWLKHNWLNVWQGLRSTSSIVLLVLAMLTAYRHASQDGAIVPGRSRR